MKKFILPRMFSKAIKFTTKSAIIALPIAYLAIANAQAADMTEAAVQSYASSMKQAANQNSTSGIARLVSDDALISLSRNGRTTSLDKAAYLDLLRSGWENASNYRYDITITNVVISGNQAKADVRTVESWTKDGQAMTVTTTSRATLISNDNNAVLLRAVAQVAIN